MKRFLLLYTVATIGDRHYAEGLIHVDGSVYVRGFQPEAGWIFASLQALKQYLYESDGVEHWHIILLDEGVQADEERR